MPGFSGEVERRLVAAGWRPGRRVNIAKWRELLEVSDFVPMHDAAEEFLTECGGLIFCHMGTGITRAREPFELDPRCAAWER
jgi:hypothetical protein